MTKIEIYIRFYVGFFMTLLGIFVVFYNIDRGLLLMILGEILSHDRMMMENKK